MSEERAGKLRETMVRLARLANIDLHDDEATYLLRAVVEELGLTWEDVEKSEGHDSVARAAHLTRLTRIVATLLDAAGVERASPPSTSEPTDGE